MNEKGKTFSEIYTSYRSKQESSKQDSFSAACSAFLRFENTKTQSARLCILYILYSYYSTEPLDHNPFLTFFLQLIDELPPTSIELHFIYCILEQSLSSLDNILPQEVCNEPKTKLPPVTKKDSLINNLKLKVTRLIDDPDIVIINPEITQLICKANNQVLTLSEIELIKNERLTDYPLNEYILPNQLPNLIDLNQFLALDIVPILLNSKDASGYLNALLNPPITINSTEVIHHILINHKIRISQEYIHYYISNCILSCDQLEEGTKRDRQVKQVARFIQSLLEKQIISMREYFIEIQSFCVSYIKLKGVTNLYRLASNEAQHQILLNQQSSS